MRSAIFLLLFAVFISCKERTKDKFESREVTLKDIPKDSVMVFLKEGNDTLDIYREVEIIENENTDTIVLGYGIVPPGWVGKIRFAQINLDPSNTAYLDRSMGLDVSDPNSYSKLFTLGLWRQKYERGFKKVTLRLQLK